MKKLFTLFAVAGVLSIVACGPSQAELDKQKKMREDSIRQADSIAAVEEAAKQQATQDSIAKAAAEQAKQDSIRIADSIANATKGKKK